MRNCDELCDCEGEDVWERVPALDGVPVKVGVRVCVLSCERVPVIDELRLRVLVSVDEGLSSCEALCVCEYGWDALIDELDDLEPLCDGLVVVLGDRVLVKVSECDADTDCEVVSLRDLVTVLVIEADSVGDGLEVWLSDAL